MVLECSIEDCVALVSTKVASESSRKGWLFGFGSLIARIALFSAFFRVVSSFGRNLPASLG